MRRGNPGTRKLTSERMVRPITVKQLAVMLGMEPDEHGLRKLRRYLQNVERQTGKRVLTRSDGARPRYVTTVAVLRTSCPEFFDHREVVIEGVHQYFEGIEEQIAVLREQMRELARLSGQRIKALEARIRKP